MKRYKIAQIHALSKQFYNVVKINIQIHALRREFLCIRFANTDDGYAVYIYYNTIKCFAFNCCSKTRKRFIAALPQVDCEAIRKAVFQ